MFIYQTTSYGDEQPVYITKIIVINTLSLEETNILMEACNLTRFLTFCSEVSRSQNIENIGGGTSKY